MIERTITFERTSMNIKFHENSNEVEKHIQVQYIDKGKIISTERKLVEDGLKQHIVTIFKNLEFMEEFISDPVMKNAWKQRNQYNKENKIKKTVDDRII